MAWGTFRGFFLFGMHHTWNTAVYQIFVLISLRNICFAFQICSLNICSSFSPYYFISVMAYNKNIHPHGIIHNKIKVKLIDSGCLNHGNLEWKDLKIFNQHLKCLYSVCSCLYWAVCSVIWKWIPKSYQNNNKQLSFPSRIYFLFKKDMISQIVNLVILDCHLRAVLQWWITRWISGIHVTVIELFCSVMINTWCCYWFRFGLTCII